MWFDGQRQPNTLYVANTSRGKDSTAMLRAIQLMRWPLDMICSVDIWFDEETPAELPPMVAFKNDYDAKALAWFGVPVTRLCAAKREREREKERDCATRISSTNHVSQQNMENTLAGSQLVLDGVNPSKTVLVQADMTSKLTYKEVFYRTTSEKSKMKGTIYGYPIRGGNWCLTLLKQAPC